MREIRIKRLEKARAQYDKNQPLLKEQFMVSSIKQTRESIKDIDAA
jgi:hypothetical protein